MGTHEENWKGLNMPKPKNKKNPYIYFCLERKQSEQKYQGKSLRELVELCNAEWTQMSSEEKRPYYETSDQFARGQIEPKFESADPIERSSSSDMRGKFDAFGRNFFALKKSKMQDQGLFAFMQEDICRIVKSEEVADFRFHIMTVHSWFTMDNTTADVVPAEIALLEMSLKNGVMCKYLQLIDPGEVPAGYKAEMKTNSEKHHDLWLDNVELVDAYDDILISIVETLTAKDGEKYAGEGLKFPNAEPPSCVISSRKRRLLPIYCLPDDKLKVRKAMEWLSRQTKIEVEFMLYDLVFLFQQLVTTAPIDAPSKMTLGAAESHLTRDVFLYLPSMSCKSHRSMESCKCAGARASRCAFIICDFCCQMYGIKPKEGFHLPDGVPVDSVLISSPYPSFHDESIEPLHELSYVADTQIAEAAKLEELPMVSNKKSQFPLGTYEHILGPLLQVQDQTDENHNNLRATQQFLSLDDLFGAHPLREFDFNETGLDETSFSQQESSIIVDSKSNSFFDDPTLHPVLEQKFDWEPGKKLEAPIPDPWYDTRF